MSENNDINTSNKTSQRPKQPLILVTILALTLVTATSTAIYRENTFSDNPLMALPGAGLILMLILTEWKGRRVLFMTLFILSILSSLIYLLENEYFLFNYELLCLVLHAPVQGSAIALLYIILCEYCDPKLRFLFLVANSAIQKLYFWITLVMLSDNNINYIGGYLQYFNVILGVFGLWSVFRWPESPYWLASKKRFEDTAKAFVEVRGSESREELLAITEERPRAVSAKMIYAPMLMTLSVVCMSVTTHDTIYTYKHFVIKSIGEISERFENFILFLVIKIMTASASVLTVLIPFTLPRKVLLLSCGFLFASNFFFLIIPEYMDYPILAVIFDAIVDYGPRIVTLPLLIELVPQKFVSLLTVFITVVHMIVQYCLENYELFTVGGVIVLVTVVICYFIMPDAREKTLIEIEQSYVSKKGKPQSIQTNL